MAKMKKIIHAGPLVKEGIYPICNRYDSPKVRAGKKKASSEAQKRMNAIYQWQKLELDLAANFVRGDLVVVLTYDNKNLPRTRAESQDRVKYFRQKLSELRRKNGQDLVMYWNYEHRHDDDHHDQSGRWHHHCVINATGDDYAQLQKCWIYGKVYIESLRVDKEKNYESLARYMLKEQQDKVGEHTVSHTRNIKKPEVETFRVPDDTPLQAPKGSIVIEEASSRTEYGGYRYIKYLGAGWRRGPRKKAVRRRRS